MTTSEHEDNRRQISVASIGECMVELQDGGGGIMHQSFGGDTLNTAIYIARLNGLFNVRVDYVTAVGQDRLSKRMVAFWETEGVGSSMVLRQEGERVGLYCIELDENGEREFSYWRGEAAARKCFEYPESPALLKRLANYDALYLSGISIAILTPVSCELLITRLAELAGSNTKIFLDYNFRPHLWAGSSLAKATYERILPYCHSVFAGLDELKAIHAVESVEQGHSFLSKQGVHESVLRDGPAPCSICSEGEYFTVAPERVSTVVDTTAAGDSFSGGYLAARMSGCAPIQAAMVANRLAAYVIGHKGAIAPRGSMPDFSDLLGE